MLKIFKHLRNSSFIIFIIILLLAGQASCELSLPTYTSNIINIGIQQSGIENSVPEVIRKSEMDKLFIFLSDKNKNTILNNYKLLNKNSLSDEEYNKYKDSYPALSDEEIYLLNTKDKDIIKKLDNILGKPELIVYGLESDDESAKMIQQQMKNNMTSNMSISNANQNLENMDMFAMLQSMPKKQKNNLIKEMNNQLINLPDAMISQSAVSFVKNEYNEIGIDTGKLQTQYILTTGA
ncbi:MAG: ABC transporter ATP-binding protein, partial [Clostridium sp.]|nr:ABC transporter ATP-binding protein [Clostridium sp.]